MTEYVFGYGSLAAAVPGAYRASVAGHRRAWTVAMDNSVDLPGYKYYADHDGTRPSVHVAFLDLVTGDGTVEGLCRPVDASDLDDLDRRERQYHRAEVTALITAPRGRTWAYVGKPESRARAVAARQTGTLCVVRSYLTAVHAAFNVWGAVARARFDSSTAPLDVPVRDLRRVELY